MWDQYSITVVSGNQINAPKYHQKKINAPKYHQKKINAPKYHQKKINAANNSPGAGAGHNISRGPGAAGVNSGSAAGSINNFNGSETTPRETAIEGNREDVPLADGGSEQAINYFFCKFPSNYDKKYFRKFFRRFGKISRIFISRVRDRYKNRYGFVTFLPLNDQKGLEKLDKKWRFGSYKFRVYRARPEGSSSDRMETEGNMRVRDASRAVEATESSADGPSGNRGILQQRDDAIVVEGDNKITRSPTEEGEKAWLYCCPVGYLRGPKDVNMVEKNLHEQGFTFSKATHSVLVGDINIVLLECPNNDNLSTLRDRYEETGFRYKGSREIGGSSKPHNNHSDELGKRNMVSERPHAEAKRFSPRMVPKKLPVSPKRVPKRLNAEAAPFSPKSVPPADLRLLRICNGKEEGGKTHKNQAADDQVISDEDCTVVDGIIDRTAQQKCTLGSSLHEGFQEMVGSEPHKTQLDQSGSQNMIPTMLDDSSQSDNGPLDLDKSNELYVDCGSSSMRTSKSNENGDNKDGAASDLMAERDAVFNLFYGCQAPNSSPSLFTYLLLILFLTHVVANLLDLSDTLP